MGLMNRLGDLFKGEEEYEENEEYEEYEEEEAPAAAPAPPVQKHPAASRPTGGISSGTALEMKVVKPERFDDARPVADHLNSKHTVVLNLESTNKEVSRRLIDFLSGVAYANNGQIKRVAKSTYIITPYNVNIMGDLLDELENSGVFF